VVFRHAWGDVGRSHETEMLSESALLATPELTNNAHNEISHVAKVQTEHADLF
jgi:hypothetical protein